MTRRKMLSLAASTPMWLTASAMPQTPAPERITEMGIASAAYGQRMRHDRSAQGEESLSDPLHFLEYCRQIGAGGMQIGLSSLDGGKVRRLRQQAEEYGMYVEASMRLPRGDSDLPRFQREVQVARNAGVTVIRTAMLSGRRYETFDSAEAFRAFSTQSWNSLVSAEPILRRNRMKLAIENHKDWRVEELLGMLKRISSESIGINVDFGNSISLLEDPIELAQAFAPYAYSTHIKDMGVKEYEDGFLLSEVPFGEGYVDLAKIVQILRQAQPGVRFNLEMITRDPLQIPCLSEGYWATFGRLPGRDLARTLRTVRQKGSPDLPRVEQLSPEERVRVEDANNRKCLAYARDHLAI